MSRNKEKANGGKGAAAKATLASVGKMVSALMPAILLLYLFKDGEMAATVSSVANLYIEYTVILYIPAIVLAAAYSYFKKGDGKRLALRIAACVYTMVMLFAYSYLIGGMLTMSIGSAVAALHLDLTMVAALLCIGPLAIMGRAYIEYRMNAAA